MRCQNILLYERVNSYLPPREFWHLVENPTIFDGPPFRQPTGSRRRNPLRLSQQGNCTVVALARGIRNRAIPLDPPDQWTWDHGSTANFTPPSFPARVPCPPGLRFPAGSPWSLFCGPSSSSASSSFPFAHRDTTTHNRLLALQHLRDVFAVIQDHQAPFEQAIRQRSDSLTATEEAKRQRRKKRNAARRERRNRPNAARRERFKHPQQS